MANLKRTELARVMVDVINKSSNEKKLAKEIAGYLVSSHQIDQLGALLRNITSLRQRQGLVEATVTTAFPLGSALTNQVQAQVKAQYPDVKRVVIDNQVEPSVLSGLSIQTIDKQLDQTARGKLIQLTKGKF